MSLSPEHQEVIEYLREEGYAVIVWTPEELEEVDPGLIQDRSIELGWDIIDSQRQYKD